MRMRIFRSKINSRILIVNKGMPKLDLIFKQEKLKKKIRSLAISWLLHPVKKKS